MALEAVVYSHGGHFGGYGGGLMGGAPAAPWDVFAAAAAGGGGSWDDPGLFAAEASLDVIQGVDEWEVDQDQHASSSSKVAARPPVKAAAAAGKRKRRRAKAAKNREEIESQRMTHIAVERNRRRQMNEYLAVLRSLMPPSYAQRGDQASIVGGAINYVRELEQLLQTLEARRTIKDHIDGGAGESPSPFAGFFAFPQYSTATSGHGGGGDAHSRIVVKPAETTTTAAGGGAGAAIADIEASMVEGHASVKVQARRRPRQLLKLVAGLHQLGLTTLHLNVTTVAAMAMYSFSLKVEDGCKLGSVEEIATAVHEILERMQEEQAFADAKTSL
ncbi:transcription factor bHLH96-like [Oryza glaberrima]|uniref:BHLH domain-containing protein n=1 Tax=Oryza glaberrima TaxID=4538 RepID=I1QTZ3_ORYGL|nr:transcription factor bHLH96-like [Oryza glaberrima]